ncbi:MAG: hypothetical protein EOO63_00535 [Hymenobacter sp.]|nr:MAG: hypothetical protein EOO63_00535 [Hymenobacter sp.]
MPLPLVLRAIRFAGLCCLLASAGPSWARADQADSLLLVLDQTLAHQTTYDQQRLSRIAGLTAQLHAAKANEAVSFELMLRVYDEYQVFKYDSAFAYSLRLAALARHLHSPAKLQTARTKLALTLRSAGLFKDAFDTLKAIQPRQLPAADKVDFYEIYSIVCIELAEYEPNTYYYPLYLAKAYAYADTSAHYARPGSYAHLSRLLFQAREQHNLRAGAAIYAQLQRLPLTAHQVATTACTLAKLYEHAGQPAPAFRLMTLAAINDLKSSTKEGIALYQVASYCYQRGDLERAHRYISEAQKAAAFFNARQRLIQMAPLASLIDGQKIALAESQRQQAKTYALAVGLLATLVLGFACISYVQLRRLRKAGVLLATSNSELHSNNSKLQELNDKQQQLNRKLQQLNHGLNEANHLKEEYIGYYFNNTARYIDKLEGLKKKLSTMLATKQLATAQRLVEEIDIKSERTDLFKGFDTVFVQLFPNFVTEFNALFTEADRIHLAEAQLLNTELRIFALIRLGITDSEQISRILGYSIHTVYAYKTRVKNRSFLPNEAFEARVLAIQAN